MAPVVLYRGVSPEDLEDVLECQCFSDPSRRVAINLEYDHRQGQGEAPRLTEYYPTARNH